MGKKKPIVGFHVSHEMRNHSSFIAEPNDATESLYDGKLTKHMSHIFDVEVTRYLLDAVIYNNTDIKYIRINTTSDNASSRPKLIGYPNQSLNISHYIFFESSNTVEPLMLKDFDPLEEINEFKFYSQSKNPFEVYIRKGTNTMLDQDLQNIKVSPKLNTEFPPVILELRSLINSKTIKNNKDLIHKINSFNNRLSKKLDQMS